MRPFAATLALLALAAAPAFAGDPAWHFKPGQTYTYECRSEFHYVSQPRTVAQAGRGTNGEGGTTTEDPQWETLVLKGTVLSIGDDGAAKIEFRVESVRVETRFDSSGDHAEWDSTKDKETDIVGYKRYQAIVGCKFTAIINGDGSIRELKDADWPKVDTSSAKPEEKNKREERAAGATHDPTPISAWLNLIFCATPTGEAVSKRTLKIPQEENLDLKANGSETVNKFACEKTKMVSSDKERGVAPKDLEIRQGNGVQEIAAALVRACQKKGESWFSRAAGCMVKVELEGATEQSSARDIIRTCFKWDISLKDRGTVDLSPGAGNTPTNPDPTPTK